MLKQKQTLIETFRSQLGLRVKLYFGVNIHDFLILLYEAISQDRSESEHEPHLFWKMVEFYIRWHLGDSDAFAFDSQLLPEIRSTWREHVEKSLHTNPDMVKALNYDLDGPIAYRVDISLSHCACALR